jgi:predicted XRE-type DNA-binding protein
MAIRKSRKQLVARSSGNVFADLRLAVAINRIIGDQRLSQGSAARRLKINQPKISALSNYRLEGFSVERLMNFLTALDRDVDIVIRRRPKSGRTGRILVTAA